MKILTTEQKNILAIITEHGQSSVETIHLLTESKYPSRHSLQRLIKGRQPVRYHIEFIKWKQRLLRT